MKTRGSQTRQNYREAGYTFVRREFRAIVLQDSDGKRELWHACDNVANFCIQYGRWGYEFGRTLKERGPDIRFTTCRKTVVIRPLTPKSRQWWSNIGQRKPFITVDKVVADHWRGLATANGFNIEEGR